MYKVLIIDDEEPSREAITILGEWDKLGFHLVQQAANGIEAMSKLRTESYDLALVDMKMPEMNGIEFLQWAAREYPDMVTLVISGYNDFKYTKQAIQSHCNDYILKPVNRTELNLALQNAVELIEISKQQSAESIDRNIRLNMSLPKLKEKIYISILEGNYNEHFNPTFLKIIDADQDNKHYAVGLLRILNLEQIKSQRFKNDHSLLHFALTNVIHEIEQAKFCCFSFGNPKKEREICVMFTCDSNYPDESQYYMAHFMRNVVLHFNKLFDIKSVGTMGKLCKQVKDLGASYEEARRILRQVNLVRLKDALFVEGDGSVVKGVTLPQRMPLLKNAIENSNPNYMTSIVSDYIQSIQKLGCYRLRDAYRTLSEFEVQLNDLAVEYGMQPEDLQKEMKTTLRTKGLFYDFASLAEFEELLYQILKYYRNKSKHLMKSQRDFHVHDIKQYIDLHYHEEIKITIFTEKYYLSREYLMKLFKQEFGYGIHEYVQQTRMEKAKQLLADPNLKIQNISEMLGYKDNNYFSKAFKNYFSCSPTEYREQLVKL